MNIHEHYMRLAISLAKRAEGFTSPNPIVGAVIVKGNDIVGKGYHKRAGLPHAEVEAARQAGSRARGATLYVTLEPCDHFGRTPPCTGEIIKSGIKKVVIGMKDPNPINNGRGIKKLKRFGMKTVVGVLEEECKEINKPYMKFITRRTPYVTLKLAESLDGKIATRSGDSKWITCSESRRYVQELRSKADAVMVGVNTAIEDNPLLLSRKIEKRQPIRIVVDSRLKTPLDGRLMESIGKSQVIIATTRYASRKRIKEYESRGAKVAVTRSRNAKVDLEELMKDLAGRSITNVLAEGGGELAAGLIEAKLVDRFFFFIAPKIIGGKDAITAVGGKGALKIRDAVLLKDLKIRRFGEDLLIEARRR